MMSLKLYYKHIEREGVNIKHHDISQLSITINMSLNRRIPQIRYVQYLKISEVI